MQFTIPGKPITWKRTGRKGDMYYDRQAKYKQMYALIIQQQMRTLMVKPVPYTEPLCLTIDFYMPIPPSWSKKRGLRALRMPHRTTPDLDNLTKFIGDALNKILWVDDALIYEIHCQKFFGSEGKTVITVEPYEAGDMITPVTPCS